MLLPTLNWPAGGIAGRTTAPRRSPCPSRAAASNRSREAPRRAAAAPPQPPRCARVARAPAIRSTATMRPRARFHPYPAAQRRSSSRAGPAPTGFDTPAQRALAGAGAGAPAWAPHRCDLRPHDDSGAMRGLPVATWSRAHRPRCLRTQIPSQLSSYRAKYTPVNGAAPRCSSTYTHLARRTCSPPGPGGAESLTDRHHRRRPCRPRARVTTARARPAPFGAAGRLLQLAADADQRSAILAESLAQTALLQTDDHHEGLGATRERREPVFRGR